MDTIVYEIGDGIYINLTNKCSNDCEFCERNRIKDVNGYYLWLDKEPTSDEVIAELSQRNLDKYSEVVFCGFGEPTYKWQEIKDISNYCHKFGKTIRINTNGQGSLINGYDITCEIAKYIDKVSISLNNGCAKRYDEVCHSIYGEEAYAELQRFAYKCQQAGVQTTLSVVDCIGVDEVAEARAIAEGLGVDFKVRKEIK